MTGTLNANRGVSLLGDETSPLQNRVRAIMMHGRRYAFEPTDRLALDVGVSPRTIRRLLAGSMARPRPELLQAVMDALSVDLRLPMPLSAREVFSPDGTYPTGSTCTLCDCDGCLPDEAYEANGSLRPGWEDAIPGDWCRYPETAIPAIFPSNGS